MISSSDYYTRKLIELNQKSEHVTRIIYFRHSLTTLIIILSDLNPLLDVQIGELKLYSTAYIDLDF